MRSGAPLLRIADLKAGYDRIPVLFGIDLTVHEGEIVALVGNNGAGKTTLLRAISRVLPAAGTLEFDGHDLVPLKPEQAFARGLVQVPEGRQLFGRMTVEENLMLGARRAAKGEIAARFDRVYALFPILGERRRQLAGNMSGGEQQMCAMARALVADPRLLMIDEMSLGLAPVIVDQLLDILSEIRKQSVAIFLVEQDVFAAFSVADRGYVMEGGRIVQHGPAAALAGDPAVRAAYLGFEEA
jgi:branched-chain amino acid transport system ATP-binding protein